MATYQEQIERNKAKKQQAAEYSFGKFCEWVANGIVPLIDDGTLTQDQGAKVMHSVIKGITDGIAEHKGWPQS